MEKNNKQKKKCPGYKHFLHPTLKALYSLGGSGSNEEIYKTVLSIMKLSDEVIDELHSFTMTEVEYKLMWARTYLKNYGAVENSRQGVWALTSKGVKLACVDNIDTKEIIDFTNKIIDGYYDDYFVENNLSKEINYKYINYLKSTASQEVSA